MLFAKGWLLSLVGEHDGVRAGMLVEKWDAEDLDACGHLVGWLVGWLVGRLRGWLNEHAMRSDKVEKDGREFEGMLVEKNLVI